MLHPDQAILNLPPQTALAGGRTIARLVGLSLLIFLPGLALGKPLLHGTRPAVVSQLQARRELPATNQLTLAIGLPLRNTAVLTNLLDDLYNPTSPNYRHFLSVEQFTEQFGPTAADYQAVMAYAQAQGFKIVGTHRNRMVLDVSATTAEIERALHIHLHVYAHPKEKREFFAPDAEPQLDLAVPVLDIEGLDNYVLPQAMVHEWKPPVAQTNSPGGEPQPQGTGSAGGAYAGKDFRAAYAPGVTLDGTGQSVALVEFNQGYYASDIQAYETAYGLPNVPLVDVLISVSNATNNAPNNPEPSLDIEMAIAMATNLTSVIIYNGTSPQAVMSRIASDNIAKQIGVSWTYSANSTTRQAFQQMAAQGQSLFNASGDSDAYPGQPSSPTDVPYITCVGGTTLTTTGPGGLWVSEKVWNWGSGGTNGSGSGGSGGISATYTIPLYQQGISMTANQGSTTMRNIPDVAMTADNIRVYYSTTNNGATSGTFGGTSCATPLWAGFTALVNQYAVANGQPTIGFINPTIYALGKGTNYDPTFHDITTGNNTWSNSPSAFYATNGYDLCTGWGTPKGMNLISAMALAQVDPLVVSPTTGYVGSGFAGGPFSPASQVFTVENYGGYTTNWSLINTSTWFSASPTSGSLASQATVSVTGNPTAAANSLVPGNYTATLLFSNLSTHVCQSVPLALTILSSSNAYLASLVPSIGMLNPTFTSNTFSYTASVLYATTNLTVTPITAVSLATITVNGSPIISGSSSGSISLNVGDNLITTVVVSQDTTVTNTYTLTVTRNPASTNAYLTNLVASAGTFSPTFASGTFSYSDSVPYSATNLTVTPTSADGTATITVNGNPVASGNPSGATSLNVGANIITTVVTAQDMSTTNSYTLTVTRAVGGTNASLSNLVPSAGTLNPTFASNTFSYTNSVTFASGSLNLTPTATDTNAIITINGSPVISGNPSGNINLNVGTNLINTVVVSEDRSVTNTYTLTVIRAASISRWWDGGSTNNPATGNGISDGGNGTWDTTLQNWDQGSGQIYVAWDNTAGNIAVFGGTGGTVTNTTNITVGGLIFTTTNYTITTSSGANLNFATAGTISNSAAVTITPPLTGTGPITKTGAGTLTLNSSNSYTGGTIINAGNLTITNDNNLGDVSGGITFGGSATIQSGALALSLSSRTITLNSSAIATFQVQHVNNTSKAITIPGKITGSGGIAAYDDYTLGQSTFTLTNTTSDFTGAITLGGASQGGVVTLNMASLADAVSLGSGNIIFGFVGTPTFNYTGSSALTLNNRQIQFASTKGGVLSSGGSGVISVNTGLLVSGTGAPQTLTLGGGNTGNNVFAGSITNGTGSVISLAKSGTGTWILSGTNTFTGNVSVSGGNLTLSGINSYSNTVISGGTLYINSIADYGTASAIGKGSSGTAIQVGGNGSAPTLIYTGGAAGCNRQFMFGYSGNASGGAISNNGTGALNFTASIFNQNPGGGFSRTITLGGTYAGGINQIQGAIVNTNGVAAADIYAVTKANDASLWNLSGTNTYTGVTTVNGGTLLIGGNSSAVTNTVTVKTNATFGGTGIFGGAVTYNTGSLAAFTITPEASDTFSNSTYMTFINQLTMSGTVKVGVSMPNGLGNGAYVLATNYVTPTVGTLTFATNSGSLGVGGTGVVSVSGNNLILTVSGVTGGGQAASTWSYSNIGPFAYNGAAHTPAISFSGSTGTKTTNYMGTGATTYANVNAPTNVGTYYVSNTVVADSNYYGATNQQTFTIKAPGNFSVIGVSGTGLTLAVTNGTPGGAWTLLQSTNLALPVNQWQTNCTGVYDGGGNLSTNIFNTATNPLEFYLLK